MKGSLFVTNNHDGISLLEVTLGVALFAMMAVMLFPAINYLYLRQQSSLRQSESTLLGQEALEIGFNVVTNNWDTFNFGDTYHPATADDGTWELLSGTESNPTYSRSISFADVYRSGTDGPVVDSADPSAVLDPDTKKIIVDMQWTDPKTQGTMKQYQIVDYILNPDLIGQVITIPLPEPYEWVNHGLVIRYTFDEAGGTDVYDVSGVEPAMDATINYFDNANVSRTSVNYIGNDGNIKTLYGVRNMGQGFIETANPALADNKLYNQCVGNDEMSVVAWLRSRGTSQGDHVRIVHYTLNKNARNFGLSQNHLGFNVRLRTTQTDLNGAGNYGSVHYEFTPRDDSTQLVDTSKLQMVTLTYEGIDEAGPDRKAKLYLDTQLIGEKFNGGKLDNWDSSFHLTLFNEPNGAPGTGSITNNREWEGELYYVAVHCEALSPDLVRRQYLAGPNNDMVVPNLPPLADAYIENVSACSGGNTLGTDWKMSNIDGAIGTASMSDNSSMELCNSGHGAGKYWQWSDQLTYVYKDIPRSTEESWIIARITDYNPSNLPKSAVGLMARSSMDAFSPYLMVAATKDKGVIEPWRPYFRMKKPDNSTWNTTSITAGTTKAQYPPIDSSPLWLGLQKYSSNSGRDVAGFVKVGNGAWEPGTIYSVGVSEQSVNGFSDDDTNYHLGVVLMSSNFGEYTRASVDNVQTGTGIYGSFGSPRQPGSGNGSNPEIPPADPGGGGPGGGNYD